MSKKAYKSHLTAYYQYDTEGVVDDAPVVMFLPGVNCGAWYWNDAKKYLFPKYKVLRFNNPGIAGTSMKGFNTVSDIVELVLEILDDLEIEKVHLVGHSMGGYVAQEFALMAPEKVDRIVLVSTSYGQPETIKDMLRLVPEVNKTWDELDKDIHYNPKEALKILFGKKFLQEHPELYVKFTKERQKYWPGKIISARHLAIGGIFSSAIRVFMITQSVLVIHGEDDPLITYDSGQKLAGQLPNVRLWTLKGVRHFPPQEQADFYPKVLEFLESKEVGEDVEHHDPVQIPFQKEMEKLAESFNFDIPFFKT